MDTADMPIQTFFLLSLADHGGSTGRHVRCLNVAGRWAVQGTAQSPLLVWATSEFDAARAAGERATQARGRPVDVVSRGDSDWVVGRDVQRFTAAFEPALGRVDSQSAAKARRLRTEANKLEAFCTVVRAASAAVDHDAFAVVSSAAARALKAKFGAGSITSAFAWLAGRGGRDALESVLAGEVELAGALSIDQVVDAVALAAQAEALQAKP